MAPNLDSDPFVNLARWIADAEKAAVPLPSTMTLATTSPDGAPHARTVLVTEVGRQTVRFHSSHPTTKTTDLERDPRASAVFHWPSLGRQVIVEGTARMLPAEVSDAAFETRPRSLQLVAWAYQELNPERGVDGEVAAERIVDTVAAAAGRAQLSRPDSWITMEMTARQVDFWELGSELAPSTKRRFVQAEGQWRSFAVLP